MTNVTQAIKHEEFIANVGRRYIDNWNEILAEEILENARNRANQLRERWTVLRTKYNELDALISEFCFSFIFLLPFSRLSLVAEGFITMILMVTNRCVYFHLFISVFFFGSSWLRIVFEIKIKS